MDNSFEGAQQLILGRVTRLDAESVALNQAVGRILAEPFIAPWGMPMWDNSAMDGYALYWDPEQSFDTYQVEGFLAAGQSSEGLSVTGNRAIKIMTGAPVPEGCNTVVPVEQVESLPDNKIRLPQKPPRLGDHIRVCGEDMREGELVLAAGTMLGGAEISLLASYGQLTLRVFRRPQVAILSTGNELVEPGDTPKPGQIVNSNSLALAAAVQSLGAEPLMLGVARDEREETRKKVLKGLDADMLITSAGISVGDRDYVQEALQNVQVELLFSKLRIKPGRPTTFGLYQGKPVFSLPGNPVSSLLTFEQFVRPALLTMMGHAEPIKPCVKARLVEPLEKKPGNLQLYRVILKREGDTYTARSAGDQNTGILSTLIRANGVALLPAEVTRFEVGDCVDVHPINGFNSS